MYEKYFKIHYYITPYHNFYYFCKNFENDE